MRHFFPCFKTSLRHGVLDCIGDIAPCKECATYRIHIRLAKVGHPEVRILKPKIEPSNKIHIYDDGTLCLYDHRDQPWKPAYNLHEKIVPWTAEWLVYYELFLITGEWVGPEAPHGDAPKEQQKKASGATAP